MIYMLHTFSLVFQNNLIKLYPQILMLPSAPKQVMWRAQDFGRGTGAEASELLNQTTGGCGDLGMCW